MYQKSVVPSQRSQVRGHASTLLPDQRQRLSGFTLAELLVAVGVLVLLVLLTSQLLNSAATVTTLGHKQMDADAQARQLFDRMALDFAQLVKRNDLDLFAKGTVAPNSVGGAMNGNDQIAFYGAVPGYYPSTGSQSPISLVAYRVNSGATSDRFNNMERLGKGLVWNAVSSTDKSVVFMPLTIAATWPAAVSNNLPDPDGNYESVAPQVFRFEYCYLLTSGSFSITPPLDGNSHADLSRIAAIVVDIAVIDPRSKLLLTSAQIASLAGTMIDYGASAAGGCPAPNWQSPGELRRQWQCVLDSANGVPRQAISAIRLYERSFYLSPPTL